MENVKISVIMPVHNGEKYLKLAMESILNQTFRDFEFIIVNDGSTDNTETIIRSYKDDRIILLNNKEKIGVSKSLNTAIRISKGDYIARMDADDISLPNRFIKQLEYLESHREIGIVGSDAYLIDSEGKRTDSYIRPKEPILIKWTALFSNPMIHPTIMSRANILKETKYDEDFKNGQDYELWSRLIFSKNIKFANLKEPLLEYRIHTESVTRTVINENKTPVSLHVSLNNLKYLELSPEEKDDYLRLSSSPKISIKKVYKSIKQLRKLENIFIKKEKSCPKEIGAIKKDNNKRYSSIIKNYLKQKLKTNK